MIQDGPLSATDGTRHVLVLYTSAGGGHIAAANAIQDILQKEGLQKESPQNESRYRVTLLNPYREIIPHLDLWRSLFRISSEDFYNKQILQRGRTRLTCMLFYAAIMVNAFIWGPKARTLLRKRLDDLEPDLVISDMPVSNRYIFQAVADYRGSHPNRRHVQGVVLMTDWAEYARHSWFPRGVDYFAVCGTEESRRDAARVPGAQGRIYSMSGLLLRPSFLSMTEMDRVEARRSLGLSEEIPTVTMLYGGQGSPRMFEIVDALRKDHPPLQLNVLCGKNLELKERFNAQAWPFPTRAVGFTDQVDLYLRASDLFIGKPGPGSVSEALTCKTRLLLDESTALPQERAVIAWVRKSGQGYSFRNPRAVPGLMRKLLDNPPIKQDYVNHAAAEFPAIIEDIFQRAMTGSGQCSQ